MEGWMDGRIEGWNDGRIQKDRGLDGRIMEG